MPKATALSPNSLALGLDFGTTNTVVAMSTDATTAQVLPFTLEGETHPTFRSAMCFWEEDTDAAQDLRFEAGPWAIERFIDDPSDCRFLQSFKTFAASKSFTETHIHGKKFTFESLLTAFIERMRTHAGPALADLPLHLVAGRPVAYCGQNLCASGGWVRVQPALVARSLGPKRTGRMAGRQLFDSRHPLQPGRAAQAPAGGGR